MSSRLETPSRPSRQFYTPPGFHPRWRPSQYVPKGPGGYFGRDEGGMIPVFRNDSTCWSQVRIWFQLGMVWAIKPSFSKCSVSKSKKIMLVAVVRWTPASNCSPFATDCNNALMDKLPFVPRPLNGRRLEQKPSGTAPCNTRALSVRLAVTKPTSAYPVVQEATICSVGAWRGRCFQGFCTFQRQFATESEIVS
jgi:hypothetical protein